MTQEEILNIDTPENVIFGYEVVGIGSRFMAAAVDTTLIIILQVIVNLTLFLFLSVIFDVDSGGAWAAALFGLISFALLWGYYIFFELLWNGQSPGKRLTNLRVMRHDGMPITATESVVRNLIRLVDFLPLFYGVGVVTMFINDQSRRLGDLAAGTLVVRDQETVTLESLGATAQPLPSLPPSGKVEEMVSGWPLERLSENDLQMVEGFLQRRDELLDADTLAWQILRRLKQKLDVADEGLIYADSIQILSCIVQLSRLRD